MGSHTVFSVIVALVVGMPIGWSSLAAAQRTRGPEGVYIGPEDSPTTIQWL